VTECIGLRLNSRIHAEQRLRALARQRLPKHLGK
jgi:hypothetical protein